MKHVRVLIVPALFAALAGIAGCKGQGQVQGDYSPGHYTGMPVIDRWMSPGPAMQPGTLEYAEPIPEAPAPPVPAPAPPSAQLRPDATNYRELPQFPAAAEKDEPRYEAYFDDEPTHTPAP